MRDVGVMKVKLSGSKQAQRLGIEKLESEIEELKAAIDELRDRRNVLIREWRERNRLLVDPQTETGRKMRNSMRVDRSDIIRLKDAGWSDERIRDHFDMLGTLKIRNVWKRELRKRKREH